MELSSDLTGEWWRMRNSFHSRPEVVLDARAEQPPVKPPVKLASISIESQIRRLLDAALSKLGERPEEAVIDDLASSLAPLHDEAQAGGRLAEFKRACQEHELARVILEDPYSRRAFEKPRGYAGDAVMLDYVYKANKAEASLIGMTIHNATTTLPNAQSLLWRRDYLASKLCRLIEAKPNCLILSVACGHMRELDLVRERHGNRTFEIWALDQDREALEECVRSYPECTIRTINKTIACLFKKTFPIGKQFDFVYSAGLADYLSDKTLQALVLKLYNLLKPGGSLTIANFVPENHGRAFMEAFMDWSLICRDEADLLRLAEEAAPSASYKVFRDAPQNVAYLEITRPSSSQARGADGAWRPTFPVG